MTKIFITLPVLISLTACSAAAQELPVASIFIIEKGLYRAQSGGPIANGTMGMVQKTFDVRLLRKTTNIPARIHQRFGLRYIVRGAVIGSSAELRLVTRLPPVGALDPRTGRRYLTQEYDLTLQVGVPAYRDFHFDHDWEIVPGRWIFEFWQGNRKLLEQSFCVFDPQQRRAGDVCEDLLSLRTGAKSVL